MDLGPDFGYFPEPFKSYVVVDKTDFAEANTLFGHLGVKVVTSHRLLGGHIGLSKGLQEYVDEKVARWKDYVARIASVAPSQPQDAYVALTKSLACEWDYLQRVVPECGPAFEPVEESLRETFLPSLFGTEISETERRLFQLPVKFSGLGIRDPTLTSTSAHQTSIQATKHLVSAIKGTCEFDIGIHHDSVSSARFQARKARHEENKRLFDSVVAQFGESTQRALNRAKDFSTGPWLLSFPSVKNDTVLSPQEFRDGLAVRYNKPLLKLPGSCDGCGAAFSLDHGLNCAKGGNVIRRHNEVRDALGQLAALAYPHVTVEPVVREPAAHNPTDTGLVCDLTVRGLWSSQTEALIDCRIVNTDAQSYAHRSVKAVLESTAAAKKTKHRQACNDRRADFSPFVCSSDGAVHREGVHVMKKVAARLAEKWDSNYSRTMSFVRQRLFVAILRASVHCVWGARKKLAPLHLDDGAALPFFS